MEEETVLAKLKVTVTFSKNIPKWFKEIHTLDRRFVEKDSTAFFSGFKDILEKTLICSSEPFIHLYFLKLGLPADKLPQIKVYKSYSGSWIIEAAIVIFASVGTAYTILKGISELPQIADGITELMRRIKEEFTKKANQIVFEQIKSALSKEKRPLPSTLINADITTDISPLLSLIPPSNIAEAQTNIDELLKTMLFHILEINKINKKCCNEVRTDSSFDNFFKDLFDILQKFFRDESSRYKTREIQVNTLTERIEKNSEYFNLIGNLYLPLLKKIEDNLQDKLANITSLSPEERIILFEDFLITTIYTELVEKLERVRQRTKIANNEYNPPPDASDDDWWKYLEDAVTTNLPFIPTQLFNRFFQKITPSEKKHRPCTVRVIENKVKRFNGGDRAEYWIREFKKRNAEIQKAISTHLTQIPSKISWILSSREDETNDEKFSFGLFLLALGIRYQIFLKQIIDSMSFNLFSKDKGQYRLISEDIYKKNKDRIERCQKIFTFIRVMSKYYPEVFGEKEKHSYIVQALSAFNRGYAYFLGEKYEKAFNDFTLSQRLLRKIPFDNGLSKLYKDLLKPACLGLKGECYRQDYSYDNAFHYYCNSVIYFTELAEKNTAYKDLLTESFFLLKAKINKSKMFLEMGEFRRALKWNLSALKQVFAMLLLNVKVEKLRNELNSIDEQLNNSIVYHEENKYEPDIIKSEIYTLMNPLTDNLKQIISSRKKIIKRQCMASILLSDIFNRVSIIFYLLNLPEPTKGVRHHLAYHWLELSLEMDENNGLAHYNKLIYLTFEEPENKILLKLPAFEKELLRYEGSIFDIWNRHFTTAIIQSISGKRCQKESEEQIIACSLLSKLLLYTDNFATKNKEIFRYMMRGRTIEERFKDETIFYCLKRWGSYTPIIPRPSTFYNRGGGFLIIHNNRGIAVDPGFDFLINLYQEGFSIADVDAVIVTHDHIDHSANLDFLLSLWYYQKEIGKKKTRELFLNPGMIERYSFLLRDKNYRVHPLSAGSTTEPEDKAYRFKIDVKKALHKELSTEEYSVGLLITLTDENNMRRFTIGFSGDTAYNETIMEEYLDSDLLIVNMCTTPFPELKHLLQLKMNNDYFEELKSFLHEIEESKVPEFIEIAKELKYAYWYDTTKDANDTLFSPPSNPDLLEHIYLLGILKLNNELHKRISLGQFHPKIIAISEIREEIGSFRNKLATFLNMFNETKCGKTHIHTRYITADIGLSVRFLEENNRKIQIFLSCTKCKLNNDSLFDDIYHAPFNIIDFCIKAEEEGLFYLCRRHDTTDVNKDYRKEQFHQRAERYNIFGRAPMQR